MYPTCLPICLPACLSICLPVYSTCLFDLLIRPAYSIRLFNLPPTINTGADVIFQYTNHLSILPSYPIFLLNLPVQSAFPICLSKLPTQSAYQSAYSICLLNLPINLPINL